MNFVISLLLTMVGYCAFPLLFASFRSRTLTKRRYRTWCFVVNFVVWLFFAVLTLTTIGSSSSGAAYLFWTWIFTRVGIGFLEDRGILDVPDTEDSAAPASEEMKTDIVEWTHVPESEAIILGDTNIKCTNCQRVQFKGNTTCNQCGAKFTKHIQVD